MDQSWITIINFIKDFTQFEIRNTEQLQSIKNKIEVMIEEDASYAKQQKLPEPVIVDNDNESAFPMKGAQISTYPSAMSMAMTTASTEMQSQSFSLLPFKKKSSSEADKSVNPASETDELEFNQPTDDSFFGKMDSEKLEEPIVEQESDEDSYLAEEEAEEQPEEDKQDELTV